MRVSTLSQQILSLNGNRLNCCSVDDIDNMCVLSQFDFLPTQMTSNQYGTLCYNESRIAVKLMDKPHHIINVPNIIKCCFHPYDPLLIVVLQENGISFIKHTDIIDHYKFKNINDPDEIPVDLILFKHFIFVIRRNGGLQYLPYLPLKCTLTMDEYEFTKQYINTSEFKRIIGHGVTLIREELKFKFVNIEIQLTNYDTTSGLIKQLDNETFAFFRGHANATIDFFILKDNTATLVEKLNLFDCSFDAPVLLQSDPTFDDLIYAHCDQLFAVYVPSLSAMEIDAATNPSIIQLVTNYEVDDFTIIHAHSSLCTSVEDRLEIIPKPRFINNPPFEESGLPQSSLTQPFYAYETLSRLTFSSDKPTEINWKHLECNKETVSKLNQITLQLRKEISVLKTCQVDMEKRIKIQEHTHASQVEILKAVEDNVKTIKFDDLQKRLEQCQIRQQKLIKMVNRILTGYIILKKNGQIDQEDVKERLLEIEELYNKVIIVNVGGV